MCRDDLSIKGRIPLRLDDARNQRGSSSAAPPNL
jgi:hypothetical protein